MYGRASSFYRFCCAAASLASFACLTAFAQSKSADDVIRSTTRAVNVSLVVTDKQGNPIKGLRKEDVTLFDGGKEQIISSFSPVVGDQMIPGPPPPGPDVYTNVPTEPSPTSVTILLFDMLNSKWTSQAYGLVRVRKFLHQIQPQDHIGLYLLNDEMKVLHGFHEDASELVEAIHRYDDEHSHSAAASAALETQSVDTSLDRFLSGKESPSRYVIYGECHGAGCADRRFMAVQITTASLEEIARQLASVSGRKTIIGVTDQIASMDFYTNSDFGEELKTWQEKPEADLPMFLRAQNRDDLERMIRLMNSSGIVVYTVDARGLETEDLDFRNTSGAGTIAAPAEPTENLISRIPEPNTDLLELASRTGGRAYFNRNDLETGIRRALDDSRFSYSMAYYPDHGRWKGEWRKIQVKVNRPEVTVLARNGYFAFPDPRVLPPKDRFDFLSEVAASAIDSPQLPLVVHIAASSGTKGRVIDARVHFNPQPLLSYQADGQWKGDFEVVFFQLGKKNKLLNVTKSDVEANLSSTEYADILRRGWTLPAHLSFMTDATQLCVILRDKLSNNVGSLHIPLSRYEALNPH